MTHQEDNVRRRITDYLDPAIFCILLAAHNLNHYIIAASRWKGVD